MVSQQFPLKFVHLMESVMLQTLVSVIRVGLDQLAILQHALDEPQQIHQFVLEMERALHLILAIVFWDGMEPNVNRFPVLEYCQLTQASVLEMGPA
jgi:hypothetical protein